MKKKIFHIVFVAILILSFMGPIFCVDTAKAETFTMNIATDKDKFKDNKGFYDCWTTGGKLLYVGNMQGTPYGVNQSMIGFDISALPDNIESVKLKIFSQSAIGSPKLTVHGSYRDDWTEKDKILPSKDVEILTNKNITIGWQSMDVTSFVEDQFAGDQYVTFVLSPTNTSSYNVFSFNSSEASANKPYLEITYGVPSIELSAPEALTEDNVDGMELNLTLATTGFTSSPITADMFSLGTAAKENGLSIESVTCVDDTHVKLKLAQDGRSIQCNFNISVSIDEQYLTTSGTMTTNEVYVEASYDITSGGTYNLDDMGVDANIEISTTEHVILTQTSQDAKENFTITYLVNNADLEIDSIEIDDENSATDYCLKFTGDSNKLTLSGNNELTAYKYKYYTNYKGSQTILIDESTMLEITGTGALIAKSGGNTAIGADRDGKFGTINITGGNITAKGGDYAAAIGGGNGGTINISGGTITANGGSTGAGIGSSKDGGCTINISGGTITATGSAGGAGIGTGMYMDGGIINISGGLIYAIGNVSGMYNSRSADIGNGILCAGCRVSITGSSVVFLKINELAANNNITIPFYDTETITDHMAYGFPVPDSWSGTAYAYISDNFTVTGVSLLPESSRLNISESETLTLTTLVTPSYAPDTSVSYSSSDETIATVDASGVVTPVSVGTATITVTTTDGGYTDTCEVTVYCVVTGVTLSPDSQTLVLGDSDTDNDTVTLEALVFPENASDKTVSYSSSDETVATVDGNGVVTAVSRGTATITVKTTDGGYTDTCDITVEQRVTGVSVSPTNSTLVLGDSDTSNDSISLTATVSPSNANNQDITWTSSDPSVATVDSSGVVTAQKAGTAIITTTTADGGFTATCSVAVEQRAFGVVVSPDLHTLVLGDADTANDTVTVTAAVSPDDASDKTVSYSSSDETVATVDGNGVVTAVSRGTAAITAKTTDGGYTDTCDITVKQSVTGVSVSPKTSLLILGDEDTANDSVSLSAVVSPSNANEQSISWSSSDPSIATVDTFGVVTAQKAGKARIIATTTDGGSKDICYVTVEQRASGVTLSLHSHTLVLGDSDIENDTVALTGLVSPDDATDKTVSYSSSDETVATVDETGVVTAVSKGSATVMVTTTDGGYTDACVITVKQGVTSVNVSPAISTLVLGDDDTKNDTVSLSAEITPSNANDQTVTWTSSDSSVATVDSSGVVTAISGGSAIITVTTNDGNHTAACNITVEQRVSGVSLSSSAVTLGAGETLTLTASVSPSDATHKAVTWTSSDTSVATVDGTGKVTAVGAGSATITATADGKMATCVVTVKAVNSGDNDDGDDGNTGGGNAGGSDTQPSATPTVAPTATTTPADSGDKEDVPDTGDDATEPTETPDTVIITIVVSELPEGAMAIKLPNGDVVELDGGDSMDIEVDAEQLSDDGSLELIAMDDEGTPLGIYTATAEGQSIGTTNTGNTGGGIWSVLMWVLIGIVGAGAIALAAYLILRKRQGA